MLKKLHFKSWLLMLCMLLGVGNSAWAEDVVVNLDNIGVGLSSTANTTAATTDITATGTTDSYTLNYYQCKKQGNAMLMTKSANAYISNKTAMPGNIKSVEVFINNGASGKTTYDCAFSTTECNAATSGIGAVNITGGSSHVFSNGSVNGKYFCVTLGNANNGQVLKLVVTCESTDSETPSISAQNVNIAYNATSGSIAYTIDNSVSGGAITSATVTASNPSGWLTVSNTLTSPIGFICSENDAVASKTATVQLTYTYNTSETVTKDVIVTQAGNPDAVNNIEDITAAGDYSVRGTIVAKSTRGFIVGDGTGYVYYYNTNYDQSAYNVGDIVKLDGSVVVYGGVFEFNSSTTITSATESNYVAEDPTTLTGDQMDSRVSSTTPAQLSSFVQYEGTLTVSGNFYNITNISGASTAKGSISYPSNTNFTSLNGKTVKVTGYYVGVSSSQYYNTMIGSVEEVTNAAPVINASDVTLPYDATSGEITYTIANPTSATLEATLTNGNWISNVYVDADNNKVTFTTTANEGTEDRTATITLSYTGAENKTVTVTQGHYVVDYAGLPFAFDGGKADIETTDGLTQSGLGDDYKDSPKLKFDGTGDYLVLKFNERPGILTFDIKGNSFSGGTFKVQTSADGVTYADLRTYTELTSSSESIDDIAADVRYIKWVYTEKDNGNVALGNIALAKYVEITKYSITINSTQNGSVTVKDDLTEAAEGATVTLIVEPATGYVLDELTVTSASGEELEVSDDYKFTMPSEAVTVTAIFRQPVGVTYTLATAITSGKHYIIAGGKENGAQLAMGAQRDNNRAAVEMTVANSTATVEEGSGVYEVVICGPYANDFYTIYDAKNGYLYAAASGSNHLKSQATTDVNGLWEITFGEDGVASIVATESSNRNVMQYNSNNSLFSCYASDSQSPVYLYEKDGEETPSASYTRTVTNGNYGTICLPNTATITGAKLFKISGKTMNSDGTLTSVDLEEVKGTAVAGTPYIFQATGTTLDAWYTGEAAAEAKSANGLVGTYKRTQIPEGKYVLKNGKVYLVNVDYYSGANKAYIDLTDVPESSAASGVKLFSGDNETAINAVEAEVEQGAIYNLAGQRVSKATKGIFIKNGKKVVIK